MSMTGWGLLLSLLLAAVYSKPAADPTEQSPTTSSPVGIGGGKLCNFCKDCRITESNYQRHVQKHFCDAAAVIQGRITDVKHHNASAGIWMTDAHLKGIKHPWGVPQDHYEYSVRVLDVYYNQTKVQRLDKITVRAERQPVCACELKVENFEDELFTERWLEVGHKYVFFLPVMAGGFGERAEAVLAQCSKVWKWTKEGKEVPGYIPKLYRNVLTKTKCHKCRVSGCYQDKCVKASEAKECDKYVYRTEWTANVCQPLIDHGFCYYNPHQGSCRWISYTKEGNKSKEPIEQCLLPGDPEE